MLDCTLTSITSTRYRSTISTTWPPPGCTTFLETTPQRKWWASPPSLSYDQSCLFWGFCFWHSYIYKAGLACVFVVLSDSCSLFSPSFPRLSMRSETTRIPSCTCWLCKVSTLPATPLLSERATRSVQLLRCSFLQTHTSNWSLLHLWPTVWTGSGV